MAIFLVILTIYVAACMAVTRLVLGGDEPPFVKKMTVVMVWIAPVMGPLLAFGWSRQKLAPDAASEPSIPGILAESAPSVLQVQGLPAFDLDANLRVSNGFPILNWEAVSQWSSAAGDESVRVLAVEAARRAWLLHLRDFFGPPCRLYESENAYVLSAFDNTVTVATAAYLAVSRARLARILDGVAGLSPAHRSVLVAFDDAGTYSAYLGCYANQQTPSRPCDGIYLDAGCPHYAVVREPLEKMEPVITREMARQAISHLDLPKWLAEGVLTHTKYHIHKRPMYSDPLAVLRSHRAYWGAGAIQEFWSGAAFCGHGDISALALDLAQAMVENLSKDWEPFREFILHARRADAGQGAALAKMGIDLAGYVCAMLEQPVTPQWSPDPRMWEDQEMNVV